MLDRSKLQLTTKHKSVDMVALFQLVTSKRIAVLLRDIPDPIDPVLPRRWALFLSSQRSGPEALVLMIRR